MQDRHEHFVQCHPEDRRLVRRTPGVGAVVDRFLPAGDALDGEHREAIDLVVVAGVIAIGAFVGHLAGVDHPFEDDLGAGRHLQVAAATLDQLGTMPAQQAGESVFGKGVRHRRDRTEDGRRIGAQRHGYRIGLARMLLAPLPVVQCAAAMAKPAHDHLVAADHLLAVDAQVLPFLVRPAGNGQTPGDQRPDIARPAGLDRQPAEVDVLALLDHFLAGGVLEHLRRHGQDLPVHRQLGPGVLEALRRLGLLELRQQLADLTQRADVLGAHAQRHALRRTEQVAEHRHVEAGRLFEQQCRALRAQRAVAHLGHLEHGGNRHLDALQRTALLQLGDEIAEILERHWPNHSLQDPTSYRPIRQQANAAFGQCWLATRDSSRLRSIGSNKGPSSWAPWVER